MANMINTLYNILTQALQGTASSVLLFISKTKQLLPLNSLRINKNYLFDLIESYITITLTYAWSFVSLAGICLVILMISGIFLAMHYTPNVDLAFSIVEYIMRYVKNGWLIRY